MGSLRHLFIDFNAFFASVEQHDDIAARGSPLIVAPLQSEHTMAIAASYEAREYGINRGTSVYEARKLCPGIIVRYARHDRYVQVHSLLKREVERHLPISKVYSIDEWACELSPSERTSAAALKIGRQVQQGIAENVGSALRSSIGFAPSRLLAKMAAESHKPDGLTVLETDDLPHKLKNMRLTKIPGIGAGMAARLERVGVTDFMGLWNLAPKQARKIWGSVQGERFWYSLHGHDVYEGDNPQKSMIGHSRVLSREHEHSDGAKIVARALLLKAASRLRYYDMYSGALSVKIRMRSGKNGPGARWEAVRCFPFSQDTYGFLTTMDDIWQELEQKLPSLKDGNEGKRLGGVTIFLYKLVGKREPQVGQGDLFAEPREDLRRLQREKLWAAIDDINADLTQKMARLGGNDKQRLSPRRYVTLASQLGLDLDYLGVKIAFSRVPEEAEFMF